MPDWFNEADSSEPPPDGLHIARLEEVKELDLDQGPRLLMKWSTNEHEWTAWFALDKSYPREKAAHALEGLGIPRDVLKRKATDPDYETALDQAAGQLFEIYIERRTNERGTFVDTRVEGPAPGRQEQLIPEATAAPRTADDDEKLDAEIPF